MGGIGESDSHKLFSKRPKHKIEPEIFTAHALGTEKSGRIVFGNNQKTRINLLFVEGNGLFIDFSWKYSGILRTGISFV